MEVFNYWRFHQRNEQLSPIKQINEGNTASEVTASRLLFTR